MKCQRCRRELTKVGPTSFWCPSCGALHRGERGTVVREPALRELLACRIGRREMGLMLEQQVRECLYGSTGFGRVSDAKG